MAEGHPKDAKTNWKGANFDVEREIVGADDDGEYIDSQNGRVSSVRGNKRSWEKIRGEEIEHDANPNTPGDWFNLGSISVRKKKFEVWVDENDAQPPLVRIDGVIVGQSPDMPWLRSKPLQMDKNESCVGGEVFLTDDNTPPMILNVQDMIDSLSSDPDKYFADFNPALYVINLDAPLDIPIFKGLVNLSGGGGLPVGEYAYSLRYANEDGDRTNWGPQTPPIPVVQVLSSNSKQYPYIKTYGDDANIVAPTSFGVKLKFRITNLVNYDFIEIRRVSYNVEAGIDVVPAGEIIAKIDVAPGEISVREFIDPAESNVEDTLADSEDVNQLFFIEKAKAIRYHDKRLVLMNIETASKESQAQFTEFNGKKIFPIIQSMGKAGHNDPINHTYFKNLMGGERYSFAATLYDGLGGRGFAFDDPGLKNFQMPNRRTEADADSQLLSYFGVPTAANTQSVVTPVHEIFDLEDAIEKTDLCSFKNILDAGSKSAGEVNSLGCPDPGHGGSVNGSEIGYEPYRPVDKNDVVTGHNYEVNPRISNDGIVEQGNNPDGFAPNYYSHGVAIGGIDNLPEWAKAFSINRTKPAGRVVCQGIGMYSMRPGDFNLIGNASAASKDGDKLWFFSPDILAGLVGPATLDDIANNPQNYSVQFVSPLGFFSEMYNFENNTAFPNRDRLVDMITYARVLHDEGQINIGESPAMGLGGPGGRYVAYNRYRNDGDGAGAGAFAVAAAGDRLFNINGFGSKTEGRGTYHEIDLANSVYQHEFTGGTGDNDFPDQGLKDFTEPMYIVNIVQDGKNVIDQNIDQYHSTGFYQKLESIIGQGNGSAGQSFQLVDERWEDCIPDLSSTGPMAADEVFVYLVDDAGNERVFMDVTFLTPVAVTAIINDISTLGFYTATTGAQVTGLYTHTNTGNTEFSIDFNVTSFFPSADEKILVRYDNRRPLRVFGGDTTVGESIFSPIDSEADATDDPDDTQFAWNIGFPFRRYKINPRHYVIARAIAAASNKIQDESLGALGYIRQLAIMFACESRISTHFAHENGYPAQYFPLVHYVIRPNRFDDSSFAGGDPAVIANDTRIHEEYFDDYPQEWLNWKFGGFRFLQEYNIDYSVPGPIEFFSKPDFGFEEENDFCTAVVWSLARAINQQDSPGLKTFLASNRFDIADENGEIKRAWDARTGSKGENLYAVCGSGICLLLTKKSILSNLEGDDLTTLAADVFIGAEYWISHDVGSNDEMWRGIAEGSIEIETEGGKVKKEALVIPNNHSVYRLAENVVSDILKGTHYFNRINPLLQKILPAYQDHVTAVFNGKHNEYWLEVHNQASQSFESGEGIIETKEVFVFAHDTQHWVGSFKHEFDKYVFVDNELFGMRDLQTYKLDQGFKINDQKIEAFLIQATSVAQAKEKEWIYAEIMTGRRGEAKPTRIEFLDEEFNLQCALDPAIQGPLYLKQYDGWRQQIPRKDLAVSPTRDRFQSRILVYKIIHNFEEDFKVIDTVIQYKPIK